MALPRFDFVNAQSMAEAVDILKKHDGKVAVMAGGTDLLHGYKDGIYGDRPDLVVNLRSTGEGEYIRQQADGLSIGALTTLHEIEEDGLIQSKYTVLAQAAATVASPQIRNNGTVGGNICQEPRCWYYRNMDNKFQCLRKGGELCNALTGRNEIHSIFGPVSVGTTPCQTGCPAGNAIPEYFDKIREGNLAEAAEILLRTNPLAAITGRVCAHTCQESCNRTHFDEAVSIRSVERAVGDYMLEHYKDLAPAPQEESGKRAAIIGSGPAGLTAAFFLRRQGHGVTVYDKMPEGGGMLRYGIPAYRLPKSVVDAQIDMLRNMGVEFVFNAEIGKQHTLDELRKGNDAVFIANGAWSAATLDLEGMEKAVSAIDFLLDVACGNEAKPGDNVVVIGGGSVAADAAITSKRLGAASVAMVCLEDWDEIPAVNEDIETARQESIDIEPTWGPNRVIIQDGKITGLEVVKCLNVFDEKGRFAPKYDRSITRIIEADSVILAIGQRVDLSFIDDSLGIGGRVIQAEADTQQTVVDGIYAGGDAMSGPATVVDAIAAGKRAAEAIGRALSGEEAPQLAEPCPCTSSSFEPSCLEQSKPGDMARVAVPERNMEREDALGFSPEQVDTEAARCFNCGCVAACPSDTAPALVALGARIKTTKRVVEAEAFFTAGILKSTVLAKDELVTEIQLPAAQPGSKSAYMKFRHRKSIDFPITSVAAVMNMDGGKVVSARIALGAAAPVPIRVKAAEEYLCGREINEEVAAQAAEAALEMVLPLDRNNYKVTVSKAMIKRAILACR